MRRLTFAVAAALFAGLTLAAPVAGAGASSWRATIAGEHLRGGATMLLNGAGAGSVNVAIRGVPPAQPVAISISVGRCMPGGGSVLSFLTAPASLTGSAAGKAVLTRPQVAALNEAISGRRPLSVVALAPGDTGCGDLVGAPRVGTGRLQGSDGKTFSYDLRYPVVSGVDAAIASRVNAVLKRHAEQIRDQFIERSKIDDPGIDGMSTDVQSFSVGLSQPSLLSVIEHERPQVVTAIEGEEAFYGFTFDLTTGRQIQLADLFRRGAAYEEALSTAAFDVLERRSGAGFARLVLSASWSTRAWGLAAGGLRFTTFGGQCCVVPITTFTVPWRALLAVLDPDSPISELLPR